MRILKLSSVLAAALAVGGCFQMTTIVRVNGDGSGTIDHSMLVTKAALAQLRNFAALAGAAGGPVDVGLISEDQARAMASELGPGVTYVSSEPLDTPVGRGRRSTYAFTDISQIRISQAPHTDGLAMGTAIPGGSGRITCAFSREPNGNAVVHINLPEMTPSDLPFTAPRPDQPAGAPSNPAVAQQLAMARALLAGARLSIALEPDGELVKTNAPFVQGSRVTLLDVDVDQVLANEALFTRLRGATTAEELKEALKEVPGLRMPLEREITIEFTPAK
jgi:hypothetical protein